MLAGSVRCRVLVDLDVDLVLADPDPIAREQPLRIAAADRLVGIVDVDAVRRRVDDVVAARAIVDARVPARYVALPVGQHPVALERAPDRTAFAAEFFRAALTESLTVATDDLQAQRHDRPSTRRAERAQRSSRESSSTL